MRSLWSVTYVGAHTATTVKKLQRLLQAQALEQDKERFVFNDENVERAVFFIEHEVNDWAGLVLDLIKKTSMLASTWQMRGETEQELSAIVRSDRTTQAFKQGLPEGLREVSWSARPDQTYLRRLISAGSSVARW